jgi:hypothetical protein
MIIPIIASIVCCFSGEQVSEKQEIVRVENPETIHYPKDEQPSIWDSRITGLSFDNLHSQITVTIEHNGPADAQVVLYALKGIGKSIPPVKWMSIQVLNPNDGVPVSQERLQKVEVVINLMDAKYRELRNEMGCYRSVKIIMSDHHDFDSSFLWEKPTERDAYTLHFDPHTVIFKA